MMKYVFIIYKYGNVFHIVIEIKNTHIQSSQSHSIWIHAM